MEIPPFMCFNGKMIAIIYHYVFDEFTPTLHPLDELHIVTSLYIHLIFP